jgi:SAM-dependent methyltransferase
VSVPVRPSVAGHLNDELWLRALEASLAGPDVDGMLFPGFPSEEVQHNFVGTAGSDALIEALRFVRYSVDAMNQSGLRCSNRSQTIIDFGCGWGRITRALLRWYEPENVLGVDPLDSMVAECRRLFSSSPVRFMTIASWPPLNVPTGSVDLIVAYSVFSHLPEHLATAWIAEFRRVLRPGGLVVATTQSRSFIELCEQMRTDPEYKDSDFLWYQLLARSFVDVDSATRRFDAGEFLHEANGGGDSLAESLYGDTLFGRRFIEDKWSHLLELVRFDDKPNGLPQACFVLRREGGPTPGLMAQMKHRWLRIERRARARARTLGRRAVRAARHPELVVRRLRDGRRPGGT